MAGMLSVVCVCVLFFSFICNLFFTCSELNLEPPIYLLQNVFLILVLRKTFLSVSPSFFFFLRDNKSTY